MKVTVFLKTSYFLSVSWKQNVEALSIFFHCYELKTRRIDNFTSLVLELYCLQCTERFLFSSDCFSMSAETISSIYIFFCFVLLCLSQTDANACWGCWIGCTWDALRCNIRGWLMGFALKAIMILASPGKYINRIILMSLGAVSAIIDCCSYSKGHSFVFLFTPYWIFQVIYCTQSLRAQSSGRCTIFSALSSSRLR